MHEAARLATTNGLSDTLRRDNGGEGHIASRERLTEGHNVGQDARMLHRKHTARTSEAGGYLVEDQQHAVLVAQLTRLHEVVGMVKVHTASSLHDRL